MELISSINLNNYIDELASALDWGVDYHAQIYREVNQQKNIGDALDILDHRIKHWFIRGGWIDPAWQTVTASAARNIKVFNYHLPDMADNSKLSDVIEAIKPLGQIKRVRSGNVNYMPASKILNFIFPELVPKFDTYWIKGVCLRKANNDFGRKRFIISGPIDIKQFKEYLLFASEQDYDESVVGDLERILGVRNPYAVAFEYCMLGYARAEILAKLKGVRIQTMSKTEMPTGTDQKEHNAHDIWFHRNWLNNEKLRLIFDQMRDIIMKIGPKLEETPVYSYVGYKYRGKLVGWIQVYRNSIEIGTYSTGEYKRQVKLRVRSWRDNYSGIIANMEKYYLYCVNE